MQICHNFLPRPPRSPQRHHRGERREGTSRVWITLTVWQIHAQTQQIELTQSCQNEDYGQHVRPLTSASRLRVDDVDPGCECALRSENRRRFWQKCAVWRGDDVSRVGLLTDSHRSAGPLSVNAHAVTPTQGFALNHAFSIRSHI